LVQVEREDFIFGKSPRHLPGQRGLADFAAQGARAEFVAQQQVARHLLRDGAAARQRLTALKVDPQCAQDALDVHAGVGVKVFVFDRNRRVLHALRDGVERERRVASALAGEDLVEQSPVSICDADAGLDEVRGERVHAREVVEEVEPEGEQGDGEKEEGEETFGFHAEDKHTIKPASAQVSSCVLDCNFIFACVSFWVARGQWRDEALRTLGQALRNDNK